MHRTPRAGWRAGAAATAGVIAVATLAGCSSSSDADNEPAAIDVATAARSSVRDGGTMRWAVDDIPATLNAYQTGADQVTQQIAAATLPTLFTVDGHGRPQRDADFLASADVVGSSPLVVDYKLNPDAVWSNGRAVGIADFTSQWKALSGDDTDFFSAHNAGYDRIEKIRRGRDAHEIKVTFSKPLAAWQSLFTPLYPKEITGGPDAFNDGTRDTLKVSAGPFAVGGVDARAGTTTLVRDRRWWGDRAKLSRLVLTAVPRAKRAAALAAGRVDVAAVDSSALTAIKRTSGMAVHKAPDAAYTQLTLNGGGSGPLADERVRRAVARPSTGRPSPTSCCARPACRPAPSATTWCSARSSATTTTAPRSAAPASSPPRSCSPTPAGSRTPTPSRRPPPRRQHRSPAGPPPPRRAPRPPAPRPATLPTATDAVVKDAVVEPSVVRTNKAGNPLTLRFVLPSDSTTLNTVGDRIAHMLAGIGVRTEMTRVSDQSFFRDHVATGDFDLALYSWPGSAFPASDARPVYLKPMPAGDGSLNVQQNYSRVGTDEIDQLLERASGELSGNKARGLAQRADARIWAEAGSLPLYQPPQIVAQKSSVANAGAFGFQTPRYQDIGFRG